MLLKIILFFLNVVHSQWDTLVHLSFSWESSVVKVCRTIQACFQGISRVLVWVEGEASPFPLRGCGVWVYSTPLLTCSPDAGLCFDYQPTETLQQQCPVSHFVISGNRWTSPKPSGCSCIFLSPKQEVERSEDDSSPRKDRWERPNTPQLCISSLYSH